MNNDASDLLGAYCSKAPNKRVISVIVIGVLAVLLMIFVSSDADAEVFEVDGIYYEKTNGYYVYISGIYENVNDWVVPEFIEHESDYYFIVGIKDSAFRNSDKILGSLTIESDIDVGPYAFANCSGITSLYVENAVLESYSFSNCTYLSEVVLSKSVVVKNSVFDGCDNIESLMLDVDYYYDWDEHPFFGIGSKNDIELTLTESITYLPDELFFGLSSLMFKNSDIGSGLTTLESSAFLGCSLKVPDGILQISDYVTEIDAIFLDKIVNLCDISISDYHDEYYFYDGGLYSTEYGVLEFVIRSVSGTYDVDVGTLILGPYSFRGCTNITAINLPKSLSEVRDGAFVNCVSLESISSHKFSQHFKSVDGVLFSKSCDTLIAFPSGKNTSRYDVPDDVIVLSPYAFSCSNITQIVLSKNVSDIGSFVFFGCNNLSKIVLLSNNVEFDSYSLDIKGNHSSAELCNIYSMEDIDIETYVGNTPIDNFNIVSPFYSISYYIQPDSLLFIDYFGSGDSVILEQSPDAPSGYTFDMWALDNGNLYEPGASFVMPSSNVIAEAEWSPIEYTICFNSNYGVEEMQYVTYKYSVECALPAPTFTKEGYYLSYWCTKSDGTGAVIPLSYSESTLTVVDGSLITLYAIWVREEYNLTLEYQNGTESTSKKYLFESPINHPEDPVKNGYSFAGWYPTIPNTMPATNLTCVALWSPNDYDLTLDFGYGGLSTVVTRPYMSSLTDMVDPTRKGYTFSHWSPAIPEKMPLGGASVVAVWVSNTYSVTFDSNKGLGSMERVEMTYDVPDVLPECSFSRVGYTFFGWSDSASGTMLYVDKSTVENLATGSVGDEGVVLYAIWTPVSYEVSFDSNGGNGTMASIEILYDSERTLPTVGFYMIGHSFEGWSLSSDGEVFYGDGQVILNLSDGGPCTLYAVWSINSYTITFLDTDDSLIDAQSFVFGAPLQWPPNPSKEGHTFTGWNGDLPDIMPANDLSFVAVWSVNSYEITFVFGNGQPSETLSFKYGTQVARTFNIVRTGYLFMGWDTPFPDAMPAKDLVISALWEPSVYSVSFDSNRGTGSMEQVQMTYDVPDVLPTCTFSRDGYKFSGWSDSQSGAMKYPDGSTVINLATGSSGDTVKMLYAVWSPISYVVCFDCNGGTGEMESISVEYDTNHSLPTVGFTKVGHSFFGWSLSSDGEAIYEDAQVIRNLTAGEQCTLYATWSINTYRITFTNTGDSDIDPISGTYGSPVSVPADPIREGHTFSGWSEGIPDTIPGEDMTIAAVWNVNAYDITFEFGNGQPSETIPFEYGTKVSRTFNIVRVGYTFLGWDVPFPDSMPAMDLTISALWSPNTYSVSFHPNDGDGSMSSMVMTYDAPADLPECSFSRDGYRFYGWSDSKSGAMTYPDGSTVINLATGSSGDTVKVLYAIWSANKYEVNFLRNSGVGEMESISVEYDTDHRLPTVGFTKVGHSFVGWALSSDGEAIYEDTQVIRNLTAGEQCTLYAIWSINTYRITFTNTGDSDIDSISGTYGSPVSVPSDPVKEGHTFTGWDRKVPTTIPDGDLFIAATWSVNSYDLTFVFGNGTPSETHTLDYGARISLTFNVERIGYVFSEWDVPIPEFMPAIDLTISAVWIPNTYSLRFDPNDGLGSMDSVTLTYGTGYNLPKCSFYRDGYMFMGWSDTQSGPVRYGNLTSVANLATGVAGDDIVTLYAVWSPVNYYLSFNPNGGEGIMGGVPVRYDSDYSLPLVKFTKVGHSFKGWASSPDGDVLYMDGQMVRNLSSGGTYALYAVWGINTYVLTFADIDGSIISMVSGTYGSEIIVPDNPVKEGYTFCHWDQDVPGSIPDHDMVFTAVWDVNSYSIRFVFNDGRSPKEMELNYGDVVVHTFDLFRTGYTFAGWSRDLPDHMPAEDLEFHALWTPNTYSVVFDPNDGIGSMASLMMTYDESCKLTPCSFTRVGYTFSGWGDNPTGGVLYGDRSSVKNLVTGAPGDDVLLLYALWTPIDYMVLFDPNGGSGLMDPTSVQYDSVHALPSVKFSKIGHSFIGWSLSPGGAVQFMDCSNIENLSDGAPCTLYAQWKVNAYSITYLDVDGSTLSETIGTYGSPITAPKDPKKEGHTFQGWNGTIPTTIPAHDVSIRAVWAVNSYCVTFVFGNGTPSEVVAFEYGTKVSRTFNLARTGYVFSGWDLNFPDSMPARDITITATWAPNMYSILFDTNGGDGSMVPMEVRYDEIFSITPCSFTRYGYSFAGWGVSPSGTVRFNDSDTVSNLATGVVGDEKVVLYALWHPVSYVIHFEPNGGDGSMAPIPVEYDSDFILPAMAYSKLGHSFVGWATSADGDPCYVDGDVVRNLSVGTPYTLYASWVANIYHVTFTNTGDSIVRTIYGTYGSEITAPADPVMEGHTFICWDGTVPETMPANDVLLSAIWKVNSYNITFEFGNGKPSETILFEYGAKVSRTFNLVRTGYVFSGWDSDFPDSMPAMDMTISAIWVPNTYSVSFHPNGGNGSMSSMVLTYDVPANLPLCSLSREGYVFVGWSESQSGTVVHSDGSSVINLATGSPGTEDRVLYAAWSPNIYAVLFDPNGGVGEMASIFVGYDTDHLLPTVGFTRVGHSFVGWSLSSDGEAVHGDAHTIRNLTVADQCTLYAVWSINTYTITFINTGDSEMGPISGTYGSPVSGPADPIREGHTFSGWSEGIPDTIPAEDMSIAAVWNVNAYDITFEFGNGQPSETLSFEYGAKVSRTFNLVRTGYAFSGWDTPFPHSMPAMDLTIRALWSPNDYTISFHSNGGEGSMEPMGMVYDVSRNLVECSFTRNGYVFAGWSDIPSGEVGYTDGSLVKNLVTGTSDNDSKDLYAVWTPNIYAVTFDPNGGTGHMHTMYVQYDTTCTLPEMRFSRIGHSFIGWSSTDDGDVSFGNLSSIRNLVSAGGCTLYAIWSINTYTITFTGVGDSVIGSVSGSYGSPIVPPAVPIREGHRFIGWDAPVPETIPAMDMSFAAEWEVDSYNITFEFDNGAPSETHSFEYGSKVSLTFNLIRTGYAFSGWDMPFPQSMPARDLTITALWTPNTYVVEFDPNGGTGHIGPMTMTYDSPYVLPEDGLSRDGYKLIGWSRFSDGAEVQQDDGQVMNLATDGRITLYAMWSPNTYGITFHSNDGLGSSIVRTFFFDSDESLPRDPFKRIGHSLIGWSLSVEGDIVRTNGAKVSNISSGDPLDLYAVWAVNSYTVHFSDVGDSEIDDIVLPYGSPISDPGDPQKRGHTFVGWVPAIPDTMPAEDIRLNAVWSANRYAVCFEDCGLPDILVAFGMPLDLDVPERIGYDFTGWSETVPGTMPDHPLTFTATWRAKDITVGFDGFPGVLMNVVFASEYGGFPSLTRNGYDLRGWYLDDGLSVPVDEGTVVNIPEDHVLYGDFVKIWTVDVVSDDLSMGSVTGSGVYDDGTGIVLSAIPSTGFGFVRWSDGSILSERRTVVLSDIRLSAIFAPMVSVSFIPVPGDAPLTFNGPVGTSVVAPCNPSEREGYRFLGWSDGSQRYDVGSDVTIEDVPAVLYGVWDSSEYELILDMGDGNVLRYTLSVGEVLPAIGVPESPGSVFLGWSEPLPDRMPARDLELTALWGDMLVRLSFDTGSGSEVGDVECVVGSVLPDIPVPTRYGHVFVGWSPSLPDRVPEADAVYTAVWERGEYTISFDSRKGSPVSPVTATYGEPVSCEDVPVRSGYEFVRWDPMFPDTMPGEDITLVAVWEHRLRSVTFDLGEGSVTVEGYHGDTVIVPDGITSRTGYDFIGWDPAVPDVFPDVDVVLLAVWSPSTFRLTYALDDPVVFDVRFGEQLPDVDVVAPSGHVFGGWDGDHPTMPAHDLTLTPVWVPECHVATFDPLDGSEPIRLDVPEGSPITCPEIEGVIGWTPEVPDAMPAHDITFQALRVTGPEPMVAGNDDDIDVVIVDPGQVEGDTIVLERDSFWSISCPKMCLDTCDCYLLAEVSSDDGSCYTIDVHPTVGDLNGKVTLRLPYLGDPDDRVSVRITDDTGSHVEEVRCIESDGMVYVVVEVSANSTCQILGPVDDGDGNAISVPMLLLFVLTVCASVTGVILWLRRL